MFSIATNIYLKAGCENRFISITKKILEQSRKESYMLWIDLLHMSDDPTQFVLYEAFKEKDDPNRHLKQPYMQQWILDSRSLFSDKIFKVPSHVQVAFE